MFIATAILMNPKMDVSERFTLEVSADDGTAAYLKLTYEQYEALTAIGMVAEIDKEADQ